MLEDFLRVDLSDFILFAIWLKVLVGEMFNW